MAETIERLPWYTTKEVAAIFSVDVQSVRNWIKAGKLEGQSTGSSRTGLRIERAELERYLSERYPLLRIAYRKGP